MEVAMEGSHLGRRKSARRSESAELLEKPDSDLLSQMYHIRNDDLADALATNESEHSNVSTSSAASGSTAATSASLLDAQGFVSKQNPTHNAASVASNTDMRPPESPGVGSSASRKRKAPMASSEEIDAELRRAAEQLVGRPIEDIVETLRRQDSPSGRGHGNERTKQTFGMAWLMKFCELNEQSSVLRSRIYARYVTMCSQHNVRPMNPASFGKLVRVIYPDLTTRRLGVRGQSKYHYCGIRLTGEAEEVSTPGPGSPDRAFTPELTPFDSPYGFRGKTETPDYALGLNMMSQPGTPQQQQHIQNQQQQQQQHQQHVQNQQQHIQNQQQQHHLQNQHQQHQQHQHAHIMGTPQPGVPDLRFVSNLTEVSLSEGYDSLMLPSMEPYLPLGTDSDTANTLAALYKAHCQSLVESLRFMHIRKFLHIHGAFIGGLTSTVQKLYRHESLQPWVAKADWIMYKDMVQMLSPLALQEIPPQVLSGLKSLSQYLPEYLKSSLCKTSPGFVETKLKPARAFASLLMRLVRVSELALNAGKLLASDHDRAVMKDDWIKYVDSGLIVARDVPCSSQEVTKILDVDLPQLLDYKDPVASAIVEHWAMYLMTLPQRFTNVYPHMFLLYMNAVFTAALREIFLNGGDGFGAWMVVRCWVDEWMGWTAEQGGFLSADHTKETNKHESKEEGTSHGNNPAKFLDMTVGMLKPTHKDA
ncbi:Transcriptional regulator RFX1 [Yarrowia sp. C11]|nr:Transcriptional regulator RFX1 [Yarrowia sp. E02]KAG5371872.1 Transcriptional regulator RFX1 [Yarrowia sp. C11]